MLLLLWAVLEEEIETGGDAWGRSVLRGEGPEDPDGEISTLGLNGETLSVDMGCWWLSTPKEGYEKRS